MKKIFTLSLFLFSAITIFSQPNFNWGKLVGGAGSASKANAVDIDATGNVYTVGSFTGTIDFDPSPSSYTLNAPAQGCLYATKFDPFGNFIWALKLGTGCLMSANALAVDASGNLNFCGVFCGTVDFDPGPGTFTLSSGSSNMFVMKLNNSGSFVWATRYTNANANDQCNGIALDASGNVFTTGSFSGTVDFDGGPGTATITSSATQNVFVCKQSSAGAYVWAEQMGGTGGAYAIGNGICVDGGGYVLTTGYFTSTGDFDPGPATFNLFTPAPTINIFISCLDNNGNFYYAKQVGGMTLSNAGISIKADASNNALITGSFTGTGDFDPSPGSFSLTSNGNEDFFLLKLNAVGGFVWALNIGGAGTDCGNKVGIDGAGNIYTTGYYNNTVDFDPGPGTTTLTSLGQDIFIEKFGPAGNYLGMINWASAGTEICPGLAVKSTQELYLTGNFQNTIDFDPGLSVFNLTSLGSSDVFVVKLSSCTLTPTQPASISGNTLMCANSPQSFTASPVGGATNYQWLLPPGWTGYSLTNTITITPSASGIVSVAATNSCGTGAMQTLSLTVKAVPSITIMPYIGTICIGGSLTLSGTGANSYTWNPGPASTTILVSPTVTTTYSINGTGPNGCTNTAVRIVSINPNFTLNASANPTLICAGETVTLTGTGAANYNWNPGGSGSTVAVTPNTTTIYTVTGTSVEGCVKTKTLSLSVSPCLGLNEINKNNFKAEIFPNPAHDVITINCSITKGILFLTDINGKELKKLNFDSNKFDVDLNGLSKGIYFLKISGENNSFVQKIVKE